MRWSGRIDIIARRILDEMPGTFVGTIHDSIMTTPDRAEAVRAVMVEEFRRCGLNPTIRLESYQQVLAPGTSTETPGTRGGMHFEQTFASAV